jgi:hypothetical protein
LSGITGSNWTVSGSNIYRSSGNVGIGTASPSQKLEVNGIVKAADFCNQEGKCISNFFPIWGLTDYNKRKAIKVSNSTNCSI